MSRRVLALVGSTAAGKSALALELAPKIAAEIVSVDSTMVYRGMDIGTDKPSPEDLERIPHHMIDVVDASVTLTVAEFQKMARAAINEISARGKTPLLVGGSGLYFRAVVDPLEFPSTDSEVRARIELEADELGVAGLYERLRELDPEAALHIQPQNLRRIVRALEVFELTGRRFSSYRAAWDDYRSIYNLTAAGLTWPRHELDRRIGARVEDQITKGLVDEAKQLEAMGLRDSLTSVQAIGYAQTLEYLDGRTSLDETVEEIKRRTRKFARRQLSWFRVDPRVRWFESDPSGALDYLEAVARS